MSGAHKYLSEACDLADSLIKLSRRGAECFQYQLGAWHMDGQLIVATVVPEERRPHLLDEHFDNRISLLMENEVYTSLRRLAPDYRSAYWQFYELSNRGFYMAPELEPLRVRVGAGGFYERMSADAAGVVACLHAFGNLFLGYDEELLADKYHLLRDFAAQHEEAAKILGKQSSAFRPGVLSTWPRSSILYEFEPTMAASTKD